MKAVLASIVIAASLLALAPTEASAWYCRARSPSASGWGRSDSLSRARSIALVECAAITPRRQVCRIIGCVP
jgi:hypothetical protein